jgi:3-methylfumaryl-CoA hydratase
MKLEAWTMGDPATAPADYLEWIGRTHCAEDEITAAPLRALSATLDRTDPPAVQGTPLPPLWHWLFFASLHRPSQMRPDGHAEGGGFMPPVPLPRRLWAGSRFTWNQDNPLRVGDRVTRRSRIESITPKQGRGGELVFVRIVHDYHNAAGLAFSNAHDSAFRGAARPGAAGPPPVQADQEAPWQRELVPDPVLLFRYSALTFNPHRIHYDFPYATQAEGYPDILVHGPLQATLLLDLLRREAPTAAVHGLEFKALRPAFAGRRLRLNGRPEGKRVALWAEDDQGGVTMQATATIE